MPQMSPINWVILLLMFLSILMALMSRIYFMSLDMLSYTHRGETKASPSCNAIWMW